MILPHSFFVRPALTVAEELIGKYLVREIDGEQIASMITEAEAYDGPEDLACHASRGRTPRTDIMFGPGGHWYIYLIYGMHMMLNVVTGTENYPAAILIRATDKVTGPGRLTARFKITKALNKLPATRESGLWIEDRGIKINPKKIARTPRIGIDYAGPDWSTRPYRFVLREK